MRAASGPLAGGSATLRVLRRLLGCVEQALHRRLSMVARRADGPAHDGAARMGAHRRDRLRRPAGAHRAAARARGGAARLDPGARLRGRQRRLPAAPRPGLDADVDLLRAPRRRATPARSPAGSPSSCPGSLLTLAIAAVALQDDPPAWVRGLGAGAAAAVVAVVAQAGLPARRGQLRRALARRARAGARLRAARRRGDGRGRPVRRARAARVRAGRARRCAARGRAAVHAWPLGAPARASPAPPRCPRSPGRR